MKWISKLGPCLLAFYFAATGVEKMTAQDAGTWQIVHGGARIVIAAIILLGAARMGVGSQQPRSEPSGPA